MTDVPDSSRTGPTPRPTIVAATLVVLLFVALAAFIALRGVRNYRVAADQDLFHLPVIRQFVEQWPRPDLSNYASATAPGYHLLLTAVAKFGSDDPRVLRFAGGLFGVMLIAVIAAAAARRSAWLALPLATSVYVLTSTVWLLPENAAWLLVAIALLLAMHATGATLLIGSAVVLALLVFVRQSHAWTFLPFAVAVMCDLTCRRQADEAPASQRFLTIPEPQSIEEPQRHPIVWPFILRTGLSLVPAAAILAALFSLWHGLTPPAFRPGSGVELTMATKVGGFAPAAPAMVLSLLGLFGLPLIGWYWSADCWRRTTRWAIAGLIVGSVLSALPVSTYSFERRSGVWNLVQKVPTVLDRSPVILVLGTLGGAVAAIALARLPRRRRLVLAAALLGFTVVQTANVLVWQRYYEPFVLIWLILAAAWPTTKPCSQRRLATAGLIVLTLFQLTVTAYVLNSNS